MDSVAQRIVAWLSVVAVIGAFVTYVHHSGAKDEQAKIDKQTAAVVAKVQEKKNEIRSKPASDSQLIKRLRSGTF